ncbi:MAG TPA: M43 family zinc metalloprotease, partial [Chitinophagales bacterium]|nr:M43 family zinc metalloprotease [Chitinophagales bacterium]
MKKFITQHLLVALMLWSSFSSFATEGFKRCGSTEVLTRQLKADPGMMQRMQQIEQFTNDFITQQKSTQRQSVGVNGNATTATVTIPVVFHVVYNTTAQNVSDAMIQSQLAVLNADYGGTNADISSLPSVFSGIKAGNTGIQFCLAQRTPAGAATTGIVRKSTTVTSFIDDDKVKKSSTGGDDAWDATKYLNIWICNLGGGLLGYAQFPGGTAATDGVVILYSSLPGGSSAPYNKGRTMTHEVGHWLNLRHIWGDANCGSDLVSDTPTQQTSNYGCPAFPHVTCSNGANGDLFMNYMDYTDDACMYMFSAGQSTRMNALFSTGGARVGLVTSQGCVPPSGTSCGTPTGLASSSITTSGATVSWTAVSGATSYTLQYKTSAATTWTTVSGITTTSRALTGLVAGTTYNYQV